MKSKNLFKKINQTKFDFVKNFKYFVIAPLALILVGIVFFFAVGFNQGIDFTGGTIVNVYVGENLNDQTVYEQTKQKIDKVLKDNGLVASVWQTTESSSGLGITVRYQNPKGKTDEQMTAINNAVTEQLFQAFGYDKNDEIQKNYIQGNQHIDAKMGQNIIINVFASIVIASIVILIYFFVRFGITSGMSALLCVYHDLLVMLSLILICRFQVNTSLVAGLIAVMGYSFVNTVLYFDQIRKNLKTEQNFKNRDLANLAVKQNLPRSIMITGAVAILLVLFGSIAVGEVASFAFPVLLGILSSFYSSNFVAPALWSFAYIKKDKQIQKKLDSKQA